MQFMTPEEAQVGLDAVAEHRIGDDDLWRLYWTLDEKRLYPDFEPVVRQARSIFRITGDEFPVFNELNHLHAIHGPDLRWGLVGNDDWSEAFGYASGGVGTCGGCEPSVVLPDEEVVDAEPFRIRDVAEVIGLSEGENDEAEWVVAGRLYDGRWFSLVAGCDYTGWD